MKKGQIVLVVFLFIAIIVMAVFVIKKRKAKKIDTIKTDSGSRNNSNNDVIVYQETKKSTSKQLLNYNAKFPLEKGSKGIEVLYLQAYLNAFAKSNLVLDGDFGNNTENALENYIKKSYLEDRDYKAMIIPSLKTHINPTLKKAGFNV